MGASSTILVSSKEPLLIVSLRKILQVRRSVSHAPTTDIDCVGVQILVERRWVREDGGGEVEGGEEGENTCKNYVQLRAEYTL